MEISGGQVTGAERTRVTGAERTRVTDTEPTRVTGAERTLASGVAAGLERLIGLFRSLSPPDGLSLTAAATLATLERSGPRRLTALAAQEGVTQPAMTQLISRLQDSGLVGRDADPADGRVVQVRLTEAGREMLARRRAVRAERLAVILARISPEDQAALTAALPAIDALTSPQRDGGSLAAGSPGALTAAPDTTKPHVRKRVPDE
jgi:DNA-binding MarR family transcriptional regulator